MTRTHDSEHMWRCHAPLTQCEYCGLRWPSLARGNALPRARDKHIPDCKVAHNGELRRVGYGEPEIMTARQQEAFGEVKKWTDPEKKFEVLYRAVEKPLPETYRKSTLILASLS